MVCINKCIYISVYMHTRVKYVARKVKWLIIVEYICV